MNIGLLILRIVVGGIFILHGAQKLMDMESTIDFFAQLGLSPTVAWVVAGVEIIAGLAVLFGIVTEIAAVFLAFVIVGAIYFAKDLSLLNSQLEILLLASLVSLMAMGSGAYSFAKRELSVPVAM
jgi:uncharacterized membrane protein YphA (DoxX/SURF4 family)